MYVGRHRRLLGSLAAAAICGAAALGAAGCGSSTVTNVIDPVAKAATVSNQAPGLRMNMQMRMSLAALPAPITGTGSGTFNTVGHTGTFSLSMSFGAIPAVTQALGTSNIRIDEILDGLTIYVKLPAALERNPALHGKPWVKINLASAANALGMPGLSSLFNNPTSTDPGQMLRYLRAASGGVRKVGTQTVDGFRTTEYRARIDLNRVPNGFPAASRAQVRQTIAQLERLAHVRFLPMTVWIDQQHLVRRMQFAFSEALSGQALSIAATVDIPQYGPQPTPQLPPTSQVSDLTGGLGMHTSSGASSLS